jgi:RNA polymerase sigma-70 factor (ECF subfamily)
MPAYLVLLGKVTMNEADADVETVKRAKSGDRAAFEELVRRTGRLVFAKLYLESGDPHRADDLVQETYLLAFKNLRQLTEPASFRPWLLGIAHRAMLDAAKRDRAAKRSGTQVGDGPLSLVAGAVEEPGVCVGRDETRRTVLDALRGLPEQYRMPLSLRYLAGADYETIGSQLGLTNGSLHGLLHRGLKLLRERLPTELGEPGA